MMKIQLITKLRKYDVQSKIFSTCVSGPADDCVFCEVIRGDLLHREEDEGVASIPLIGKTAVFYRTDYL